MKSPRLAVIQFPGSNCEYETRRAAEFYGFDAEIVRWNAVVDWQLFQAFILPGGFSYQDRVRAGAIAAKLPVMDGIAKAASLGIPVLGICNGCQILAESGLIAGSTESIDVGMAPNTRDGQPVGFICDWRYIRAKNAKASIFTRYFDENEVLPIPINHGEGRFVLSATVEAQLHSVAQWVYCDSKGNIVDQFPINPNGATQSLAGLCNDVGNVLGIMPHPERSAFLKQVPLSVEGQWHLQKQRVFSDGIDGPGPLEKLFVSMVDAAKERQ